MIRKKFFFVSDKISPYHTKEEKHQKAKLSQNIQILVPMFIKA